jgi:hypothetical protein
MSGVISMLLFWFIGVPIIMLVLFLANGYTYDARYHAYRQMLKENGL